MINSTQFKKSRIEKFYQIGATVYARYEIDEDCFLIGKASWECQDVILVFDLD